jgi:hypothetical protein
MIHLRQLFLFAVLAAVLCLGIGGASAQEATPEVMQAHQLTGTFSPDNPEISFPVPLEAGQEVVIVINTEPFILISMTDPAGEEVIGDFTRRLTLDAQTSIMMPLLVAESGEYTLTLRASMNVQQAPVTARVIPMAGVPEIDLNEIYEESLGPNTANLYAVQVQEGDLLNPQVFTRAFDAAVRIGMQQTPSTGFDGLPEFNNFFLLRTAPYRVPFTGRAIVAVYSQQAGVGGNYVMAVFRPEGLPVLETDGTPLMGALNTASQLFEQAVFTAQAGDLYSITIDSEADPSYQVQVTSPSNALVVQSNPFLREGMDNSQVTIPLVPVHETGEYVVTVHPSGTADLIEGGYALTMTRVEPPLIDETLVIGLSGAYEQEFGAAAFEGEAGEEATVTLTSLNELAVNPAVRAYQNGELLAERVPGSGAPAGAEVTLTLTPVEDGPVTLVFSQEGFGPPAGRIWEFSLSVE